VIPINGVYPALSIIFFSFSGIFCFPYQSVQLVLRKCVRESERKSFGTETASVRESLLVIA